MAGDDIRRDWSLRLEGFGRIAQAAVEVKPFTVLVGANNTGKSYLASLIWGIEGGGLASELPIDSALMPLFGRWLVRDSGHGDLVEWTDEERSALKAGWDDIAVTLVERLCASLFDEGGIAPSSVGLDSPAWQEPWQIGAAHGGTTVLLGSKSNDYDGFGWMPDDEDGRARMLVQVLLRIAGYWRPSRLTAAYSPGDPVFLPASRTGFSLFMHAVVQDRVSSALRHRSPDQVARSEATRFTLPQIHLLNALLVAFGGKPGPFADEADRLEAELEGRLSVEAVPGATHYRFTPAGSGRPLGLQLSSALVTELMPLVITLRYARELPFLVLEEPEAHLHPGVQRAVIRCLGRLVRRGVRVLITTHSTTVAQQLNNLVKLGALSPEERVGFAEFGYGPDDHLAADEVAVHHFGLDSEGRSIVEPVEAGPGGFPMPTFNDLLGRMAEETSRLYAALDRGDEG